MCLCVDAIILNEDRHLNNLSVIKKENGEYREAPIYDNGLSCLSDTVKFPIAERLRDLANTVRPREFSSSYFKLLKEVNPVPLKIRYEDFINSVFPETEIEKRCFSALLYGLEKMEGLAWVKEKN